MVDTNKLEWSMPMRHLDGSMGLVSTALYNGAKYELHITECMKVWWVAVMTVRDIRTGDKRTINSVWQLMSSRKMNELVDRLKAEAEEWREYDE